MTAAKKLLATNLRRFRAIACLSQEELAARSDLSTRCYGKIERAEVQASLATLDKLAKGTGLHQMELLR